MQSCEKEVAVNRTMKDMCVNNQWCFIDNDNIDDSCLWRDGVHLNDIGKKRLATNIATSMSNFTETKLPKYP